MRATGIVRRIDELGRVVIPKEIRRTLRIREGDPLEIYTENNGEVVLKKYSPIGEISQIARDYSDSLYRSLGHWACICDRDAVVSVSGGMKLEKLVTDKNEYTVDGVFFLRESVSPGQLVPGLEMADGHVAVDRQMVTNIPGCFACGDITGQPYQYVKSAGEGNVAALSAVSYLDAFRRKNEA